MRHTLCFGQHARPPSSEPLCLSMKDAALTAWPVFAPTQMFPSTRKIAEAPEYEGWEAVLWSLQITEQELEVEELTNSISNSVSQT